MFKCARKRATAGAEQQDSGRPALDMWEATARGGFICTASLANNCTRLQYLVFQ